MSWEYQQTQKGRDRERQELGCTVITRRPLVPVLSINPTTPADDYYTERKMWTLTGELVMPRKPSPSPPPSPERPKAKEKRKGSEPVKENRERQKNGEKCRCGKGATAGECGTRIGKAREEEAGERRRQRGDAAKQKGIVRMRAGSVV